MNEGVRESLSAFMDGEATELEIQRVLRDSSDAELRATWTRYHLTRSAMQELHSGVSVEGTLDFATGVMTALEESATDASGAVTAPEPRRVNGLLRPFASLAIAASVAGAVVVGGQWLDGSEAPAATGTVASNVSRMSSAPLGSWGGVPLAASIQARPGNRAAAVDTAAIYDALARERLQRYMLYNAEHAALNSSQGMMPYARVSRGEKR